MRFCLLLGRGIEGCGVTRLAIEFNKFLILNDYKSTIFHISDKIWPRMKLQEINSTEINNENIQEISKYINKNFDYIFYLSVPSLKHSQECIDNFFNYLVLNINIKKIMIQCDHKLQSINRNANIYNISRNMDGIFVYNKNALFSKKLNEYNLGYKLLDYYFGIDIDDISKYRIKNKYKKIIYFGRFARFKNPHFLYELHKYIKKYNFITEFLGVERSIGALFSMFNDDKKYYYEKNYISENIQNSNLPYMYGPYNRNEGLKRLSRSLFGCDFYTLASDAYGFNLEYSQYEIIGVGCIPIFTYNWAIDNILIDSDIKFIDIENFALYLKNDLSNIEEISDSMEMIYNNKKLIKKYNDIGYDIIKKYSSDNCFKKILNQLNYIKKIESFF
jgi:hypothetical protein